MSNARISKLFDSGIGIVSYWAGAELESTEVCYRSTDILLAGNGAGIIAIGPHAHQGEFLDPRLADGSYDTPGRGTKLS